MTLENFGRNVRFAPADVFRPTDQNAVLACLDQHRGHNIRAIGGLHAWSEAAVCRDVILDLRHLDRVTLHVEEDGGTYAEIEAGCTIDRVLDYLRSHGGYTLPTYGIIGKQTMAGAVATATHGSGRASLSHYVRAVCVAGYDSDSGRARTYNWDDGEALRAARCGLGCTGILMSVRMGVEPDYLIEEQTRWFERIDDVLDQERDYPRQQFYLIPWSWGWYAQLRRPLTRESGATPGAIAHVHRIFRLVGVDAMLNGAVRLLSGKLAWWVGVRWFYRRVFPWVAQSGIHVTDHASDILRMRHDLYIHVEMELFVPAPHVTHAAAFVEWVLRWCGGESPEMPAALTGDDFGRNTIGEVEALRGCYVHDYPITFRRVLCDDTLISMTSGDEADAWYAISLITYQHDRRPFLRMATFMAAAMASAYRARPHWGKICPLDREALDTLYPALPRFRAVCASVDPDQAFVNDFARRVLGF
jgi:FAD/FMN-containing dehydrogenase